MKPLQQMKILNGYKGLYEWNEFDRCWILLEGEEKDSRKWIRIMADSNPGSPLVIEDNR